MLDFTHGALLLAFVFGFLMSFGIGANDVANAMGTSVGSQVISTRQAILIAMIFESLGALIGGNQVSNTLSHDLLAQGSLFDAQPMLILGMLSAMFAAGLWLLIATSRAWPVSTTHTLVGALLGIALVHWDHHLVDWETLGSIILGWIATPMISALIAFALFSLIEAKILNQERPADQAMRWVPLLAITAGSCMGYTIFKGNAAHLGLPSSASMVLLYSLMLGTLCGAIAWLSCSHSKLPEKSPLALHYNRVHKDFGVLVVITACAMAFAHGSNDVANAVGPLNAVYHLTLKGQLVATTPWPLLMFGAGGICLGLMLAGHKVMHTIGHGITTLTPVQGFVATFCAALTVMLGSTLGLPLSTTHTLVGSILGAGLARGMGALNVRQIQQIILSWFITVPAGALLCAMFFSLARLFLGIG